MLGDSLYLENIQEYVHDEEKIVSYKWLSRKLEVPVNVAKQMLYAFVNHCCSSEECADTHITVTYIVSGFVGGSANKEHQVYLVDEDSLEATKEQFHQVLGVHIFSVQKAPPKDSGCLYTADYEVSRTHLQTYSKWSTIECPAVPPPQRPRPPSKQAVSSHLPKLSHMETKVEPVTEDVTPQSLPAAEVKVKSEKKPTQQKKGTSNLKAPAKGSVASFFAKQGRKTGDVKVASEPPVDEKQSKRTKPQLTISPKKSPVKSPVKSPGKRRQETKVLKKTVTSMIKGLHDSDIEEDESDSDQPAENPVADTSRGKSHLKTAKAATSKGPVKQLPPGNAGARRKRKRVQDLSSDEESADETGGAQMPKSNTSPPKRRKRLVTKMYVNDEGAMVTEKVWENASEEETPSAATTITSDKDAEVPLKSRQEKLSPVKASKGAKQSSLMSFFKK